VPDVLIDRDGPVLRLTLNRPEVLNAVTGAAHAELAAALGEAADPAVRVVVLTGAGRAFCVGQDLRDLAGADADIAALLRAHYHPTLLAMRALRVPVLAAVNGPAAGAGLGLACACDLRIASGDASFVPAFVSVGLVPDSGASWFLARILGPARAFEWLVSGRRLGAAEALGWGLVSEVVPAEAFEAAVADRAARLAAMPTRAVALTRRALDAATANGLDAQLELEAALQAEAFATEDFAEGAAAFLEKREPRFRGR
jgi:2-(1,2-epoxy-1,2-dihydrophenyl)acetyl-CoA isomerase